jgi:hypothetical protein
MVPLTTRATKSLCGARQRMITPQTDNPTLFPYWPSASTEAMPPPRRTGATAAHRIKEPRSSHGTPTKDRPDFPARQQACYARRAELSSAPTASGRRKPRPRPTWRSDAPARPASALCTPRTRIRQQENAGRVSSLTAPRYEGAPVEALPAMATPGLDSGALRRRSRGCGFEKNDDSRSRDPGRWERRSRSGEGVGGPVMPGGHSPPPSLRKRASWIG